MAKTEKAVAGANASSASPEVEKPEVKKIPKAIADSMRAAGDITQEIYDKWLASGRITSGTGGGENIYKQLESGGVSTSLIESFKKALEAVISVLWKDAKTYIGKTPNHKFSFQVKDEKGVVRDVSYEAPAEIELAAWVKHFDSKAKENRAAAIAKAGIVLPKKS